MELAAARAPPLAVANCGALPIDVLLDILLRLPADEICRLQLVCRSWRTLTSDRLFTMAYALHHPPPHVVIVRHRDDKAAEVRAVDVQGNVIMCVQIRQPIVSPLSIHGNLLCASHGWKLTSVVDNSTWSPAPSRTWASIAGRLAYFLGSWGPLADEPYLRADSLVVFDLATEQWKPKAIRGPLTSWLLSREDNGKDYDELTSPCNVPYNIRADLLLRRHFQLVRLDETLVVLCCNPRKSLTMLWFLEDMVDDRTTRWSKRYTLRCTPFGDDKFNLQYHYPLAVLDDGRILVSVDRTSALKAYDPETCTWNDLPTLTADCVVGSLLC